MLVQGLLVCWLSKIHLKYQIICFFFLTCDSVANKYNHFNNLIKKQYWIYQVMVTIQAWQHCLHSWWGSQMCLELMPLKNNHNTSQKRWQEALDLWVHDQTVSSCELMYHPQIWAAITWCCKTFMWLLLICEFTTWLLLTCEFITWLLLICEFMTRLYHLTNLCIVPKFEQPSHGVVRHSHGCYWFTPLMMTPTSRVWLTMAHKIYTDLVMMEQKY
jgi:hypothetical protein